MINTSDLFKEKKFPDWFAGHSVFKTITKIKKVFPGIGLPNSDEEVVVNNINPAKTAAKQLVSAIKTKLQDRIKGLKEFIGSKPDMSAARQAQGAKCLAMLNGVYAQIDNSAPIIREENGRFVLKLASDFTLPGDVRPIFRANEGLFRVYNKINEALTEGRFAKLQKLEDIYAFKTFSTDNIPNSKFRVIFSADGIDGAWDIATMSMRGVKSCQSWDGDYRHCTIGSVVDPFVGIIYLTSGAKCEHGTKMIKRSIVRFVIDATTNKPYILLDNMYPGYDEQVFKQFKKFLKAKTGDRFDIKYAPNIEGKSLKDTYMPLNNIRKLLRETSSEGETDYGLDELSSISSYQDVRIQDKTSNKNDKHEVLYEKNSKKKANLFVEGFGDAFKSAIDSLDENNIPDVIKPIFSRLKGTNKKHFNYTYYIPEISRHIANGFVKSVDRKSFTSSDLFHRRLFHSYFANKNKILNEVKAKTAKEINGKLKLKGFGTDNFTMLMKLLLPKIDEEMKKKLAALNEKKKSVFPLPLP
jgi:hypothetical protein